MAQRDWIAEPLEQIRLRELCSACGVSAELVVELVDEGVLQPTGSDRTGLVFAAVAVRRVRVARRLQRDLGVNHAGAALALDLLDELHALRDRLRVFEGGCADDNTGANP